MTLKNSMNNSMLHLLVFMALCADFHDFPGLFKASGAPWANQAGNEVHKTVLKISGFTDASLRRKRRICAD